MRKQELKNAVNELWDKNIIGGKVLHDIKSAIDKHFAIIEAPDKSQIISENEELEKDCDTCKHFNAPTDRYPCSECQLFNKWCKQFC